MNSIVFASFLLVFSTAVVAFQEKSDRVRYGHKEKADVNSPEIKEMAKKTVKKHFGDSSSVCTYKVERILSAEKAVVAGNLYVMELKICPDMCKNEVVKLLKKCKVCTTETWEKSWENFLQVKKFDCRNPNERKSENRTGSLRDVDVCSSEIKELATAAVKRTYVHSPDPYELKGIIEAKQGVVAGTKTVMELKICQKRGDKCKKCDVETWEKEWLKDFEVTKFDCYRWHFSAC